MLYIGKSIDIELENVAILEVANIFVRHKYGDHRILRDNVCQFRLGHARLSRTYK